MDTCEIDGCDRRAVMRTPADLCPMHYARWWRNGHFEVTGHGPRWVGNDVNYRGAHQRVRSVRGKATEHACPCGRIAQHWSYNHNDPDEKVDDRGRPYSPDPDFYVAMCVSCHKKSDMAFLRASA